MGRNTCRKTRRGRWPRSCSADVPCQSIEAEKDRLSELDGAIGDGDHGITMSIRFKAVVPPWRHSISTEQRRQTFCRPRRRVSRSTGASWTRSRRQFPPRVWILAAGVSTFHLADDMLAAIAEGIDTQQERKRSAATKTMLDVWLHLRQGGSDGGSP